MRTGALNMKMRRRFDEGGGVDPSLDDTSGIPPQARAAQMRDAQGQPALNNDFQNRGAIMRFGTADPNAINSQWANVVAAKDAATQAKYRSIQDARNILAQVRLGQSTNLPMMAFAQGMLAPTHTGGFAEAMSAGLGAALPQVQQQRQQDLQYGQLNANLGMKEADTQWAAAEDSAKDFMDRMKMQNQEETWGMRTDAATQRALQVQQMRGTVQTTIAGIKDKTLQLSIATRMFLGITNGNEKQAHDLAMEAIGQQNADTNTENAASRGRVADARVGAITGLTPAKRADLATKDPGWITDPDKTLRKYGLSRDEFQKYSNAGAGITAATPAGGLPDTSKPPPAAGNPFDK